LKEFANQYDLKVFVETGTYYGDMINATKKIDKIYSIELDQYLFEKARKRFESEKHIEIIQGDSSEKLGKILEKINQPALFWLDGQYSGGLTARGDKDTPIYTELEKIFDSKELGHVIVIDDALWFRIKLSNNRLIIKNLIGFPSYEKYTKQYLKKKWGCF
jgi:hypothetical protein